MIIRNIIGWDGNISESNGGETWSFVVGEMGVYSSDLIPEKFALQQNYPNPFNPITYIRYDLPEDGFVSIIVIDVLGQRVRTLVSRNETAGYKTIYWDSKNDNGTKASAGIYFIQIIYDYELLSRKMILLR